MGVEREEDHPEGQGGRCAYISNEFITSDSELSVDKGLYEGLGRGLIQLNMALERRGHACRRSSPTPDIR